MVTNYDGLPFEVKMLGHIQERVFYPSAPTTELKWHQDNEDRLVELCEPTDWWFQMDNELPIPFPSKIFIPKNTFHRVIKGVTHLKVKIYFL